MRVRAGNPSWGWNRDFAARVTAPTMIVVGEQDNPEARGVLYKTPHGDRREGARNHELRDALCGVGSHSIQVHASSVPSSG